MSRTKSWARAGSLIGILLLLHAPSPAAPESGRGAVRAWDIRLRVAAEGDYHRESGQARTDGTYAFDIEWTGTIERDENDFLLVHTDCILKSWTLEERNSDRESVRTITDEDAPDKPELKVNYVLNEAGRVRFDFLVAGFDVPLAGSEDTFPLVFPVSAESGVRAGAVAYNSAIRSGSNDVAIDAAKLSGGPAEERFAWTWRRQAWVQLSDSLVFQGSGHKVKVVLTILPIERNVSLWAIPFRDASKTPTSILCPSCLPYNSGRIVGLRPS